MREAINLNCKHEAWTVEINDVIMDWFLSVKVAAENFLAFE
jgi:hypothetical protein